MLSLPPRFDLFKFSFPKELLPDEVAAKYQEILNKNTAVITNPIDYLNESIQGVSLPGISDIVIQQPQVSHNASIPRSGNNTQLGHINIEPNHDNTYLTPANPLANISKEFKVTLRLNQGLMNYFMLYESIFYRICKNIHYDDGTDVFMVYILDENGVPTCRIKLLQLLFTGIDGLEFNYSKFERSSDTFDVTFQFNNIDIDFVTGFEAY